MKKIFLYISAAFLLASCDMDTTPEGSIPDTDALKTVEKCESFRYGLYALMRGITTGGYITYSEIQMDNFHAVRGNGNRVMEFYNGNITPSTGDIEAIYAGYYAVIAQTNFFIGGVVDGIAGGLYSESARTELDRYVGEAHLIRAFCYSGLADKFCASYKNAENVDAEASGLSLQLVYEPTGDNSKFPGRSTLRATYNQILDDINAADSLLTLYETATGESPRSMSEYVSSDVAKALKARVCLNMGLDKDAASAAAEVIATERYPLTSSNSLPDLWRLDEGTEVLWRVQMELNYQGSPTGVNFQSAVQNPDYVPTDDVIALYSSKDKRYDAYFSETELDDNGQDGWANTLNKYPGNPALYANGGSSNYSNMSKPFRSAELYLIAAEAYSNLDDEALANKYLSDLQQVRFRNLAYRDYTGVELITEIRDERHRELLCEGFRMADLKRWGVGFTRGSMQYETEAYLYSLNANLTYDADDHRFVWPIPKSEIDANPQIKYQQNPGY